MFRRLIMMGLALTLALGAAAPGRSLAAESTPQASIQAALTWMRSQQKSDGSFLDNFGWNIDAVLALNSAGIDPSSIVKDGKSPLDYLATQADTYTNQNAGKTAKLILGVLAGGKNPRSFGGVDLVKRLNDLYIDAYGQYGPSMVYFDNALALLALRGAGLSAPANAITVLTGAQRNDGSWGYTPGAPGDTGDTNTTAVVVQALVAHKPTSGAALADINSALAKAVTYFKSVQNSDGGFPYQNPSAFGTDTDANSTAYVIQAIVALGQSPTSAEWTKGSNTPVSALMALQNTNGAFGYQKAFPDDSALATFQAVPALALRAQPIVRYQLYLSLVRA